MKGNNKRITLCKKIWSKIRYYQLLNDLTNKDLAAYIGVSERTLLEYDKNAHNITLGKVESFLGAVELSLDELLSL